MNKSVEASPKVPGFTCPEIFPDDLYARTYRKIVDTTTAEVIHDEDLVTQADNQIDEMRSNKAGTTSN
jgi:hypothetical protein